MSKYFDTKPGSLEEAVSAAQQAAIAISKKERGEKPKDKKDENNFVYAAKMAKKNGEKTFTIGGKEYNVEDYIEEEKIDFRRVRARLEASWRRLGHSLAQYKEDART